MKLRFQQTFRSRHVLFLIALLSGATGVPIASAISGDGHWDRQFSLPGVTNLVYALRFNGDALYAGGLPIGSGGLTGTNTSIDIFDGTNWSSTIGEFTAGI